MDFPFYRSPERHQQETKVGRDVDLARADLDPAIDATTPEVERVTVPVAGDVELLRYVFGHSLHGFPGFRQGPRMSSLDVDAGHAGIGSCAEAGRERPILLGFTVCSMNG